MSFNSNTPSTPAAENNDEEVMVSVRDISKSYILAHNRVQHTTLGEAASHWMKSPFQRAEQELFWSLRDISFDVKRGEVLGIIGRNGAGKSTLLKILSRITEPTSGEIQIYGSLGSLLEVGTGFHPELTGRENIFLNGAILGMKKRDIQKQFDAIVDFAGTEQFLDTPVKRYSSGMYVRLAFSVAAHLSSDILIVDEVLAVGDVEFQKKCMNKMQDVTTEDGKTVMFVSHNMNAIATLTSRVLMLESGRVSYCGDTSTALHLYQAGLKNQQGEYSNLSTANGVRRAKVQTSDPNQIHAWGQPLRFEFDVMLADAPRSASLAFQIVDETARVITGLTLNDSQQQWSGAGAITLHATIDAPRLYAGDYSINVMMSDTSTRQTIERIDSICHFQVTMDALPNEYGWKPGASVYMEQGRWEILPTQPLSIETPLKSPAAF